MSISGNREGGVIMVRHRWLWRAGLVALLAALLVVGSLAVTRGNTAEAKGPPTRQFTFGALD